jgi:hypothetical protein
MPGVFLAVCTRRLTGLSGSTMTDLDRLQALAAYYRAQADACHQMAQQASDRFSRDWLDLAKNGSSWRDKPKRERFQPRARRPDVIAGSRAARSHGPVSSTSSQ